MQSYTKSVNHNTNTISALKTPIVIEVKYFHSIRQTFPLVSEIIV